MKCRECVEGAGVVETVEVLRGEFRGNWLTLRCYLLRSLPLPLHLHHYSSITISPSFCCPACKGGSKASEVMAGGKPSEVRDTGGKRAPSGALLNTSWTAHGYPRCDHQRR
jgi:hypothetical protein